VLVPFAPPVERTLPWLYAQCSGDWILRLDDDEVPSQALLDGLRELAADDVTHVWLPRRWLHGDGYLDAYPWVPDFQLRLTVNDPRLVRFPGVTHVPLEVAGAARYADAPLYHLDLLRPLQERLDKAAAYEQARPGLRLAGRAFNHALYVPETVSAPVAEVPAADASLIRRVLDAPVAALTGTDALRRATRAEIDALWPRGEQPLDAELVLRSAPSRLTAGERAPVVLEVHNRAATPLAPPAVQVGSRWDGGTPGIWTALPAVVGAGATETVVATVQAPPEPGRHVLELDLVQGDTRWLGRPVRAEVDVKPRVRVGVLVRDATRDHARALADAIVRSDPSLEPVFVGAPSDGYPGVPGPEVTTGLAAGSRKLRSFLTAARRVRALRRAPDALELDALVLSGLEATTLLERWTDLAAVQLAADRALPILVPQPPAARGALDRFLLGRLVRTDGVAVGVPLEEFLDRV
jgi:hypothetical protein